MLHSQSRFCILFCFFLLLFDDGFSKPSSFLKSIRSLHRSEKGKTRLRRNLPSDEQSNDENNNSSEKNGKFWKENTLYEQFYVGPVCDLIDVRHNPFLLEALENCTMVDGNVHIAFINDGDTEKAEYFDLAKFSFPKLRVITEHLLIYRVYGLKTLRHLFPNLVMIGGQKLFSRYALTIFENPDLTEVGLDSLKYIKRGGVRIENNGNLCHLGTVDWQLLGKVPPDITNKQVAKPKLYNNNLDSCIDQCSAECKFRNDNGVSERHCWGHGTDRCQKKPCPSQCLQACTDDLQCTCHSECLGGCSSPQNASACYACKHLFQNNTCVRECPTGTLLSASKWHCVTTEYCKNILSIAHGGECLARCPPHHRQVLVHGEWICEKCDGSCHKECTPTQGYDVIDSERSVYKYNRCTVFRGQLIISLSVADMTKVLEKFLGELEEIGALVVRRSAYLTSLSFLSSLKRITGEKQYLTSAGDNEEGYSVYILDNKRLKDLWNVGQKVNFTIGGGKAFFHFNPYLCMDKIQKIANLTKAVEDSNDISQTTNGDRITCNMDRIEDVVVTGFDGSPLVSHGDNSVSVKISWKTPNIQDPRTLIGYIIYYRQKGDIPLSNDELFEESSWNIDHLNKNDLELRGEGESQNASTLLNKLRPYTEYMFYIATYTTAQASKGAKSDIKSFQTRPSKPSFPRSVTLQAINDTAMQVQWEEPRYMNGRIDHYIVKFHRRNRDQLKLLGKNVCKNKETLYFKPAYVSEEEVGATSTTSQSKECSCDKQDPDQTARDVMDSVQFEDYLINELIAANDAEYSFEVSEADENVSRKKRSIEHFKRRYRRSINVTTTIPITSLTTREPMLNYTGGDDEDYSDNTDDSFIDWSLLFPEVDERNITVNGSMTKVNLTGLTHFTEYVVSVQACNHAYKEVNCSKPQVATRRTKMLKGADNIVSAVTVEPNFEDNKNNYLVKFDAPEKPNSLVILYTIKLTSEIATQNICCSHHIYERNNGCEIIGDDLKPGTYKGQVEPLSLAGPGELSAEFSVFIDHPPTKNQVVLQGVLSSLSAFLVLVIIVGCIVARKRLNSKQPPIYASVNPEYSSVCVEFDEYEIDEDDIKLLREIGQGHFGKVYEGIAQRVVYGQSETRVAVKTGHGGESVSKRMEFLKEASVMKAFNSHHVVRLLGVVSKSAKPMMVMEYMYNGDLKTYLRSIRPDAEIRRGEPLTLQQKLQMCGEIADGMAYLSDSKYVHRDLAARNCLVHEDMTVKISDFGLTRDVYETDYYRIDSRGILPVRWMAPESLKDGVFDSRSDVWSYGVVLWEIATLAEQPYQGRQHDEVTRFVIDGGYMEQPRDCPKKLYDLMLMCWHYSPGMRPNFLEIVAHLLPDLSDHFKEYSFYGEQKEALERDNDESPYINGSEPSTEGLLQYNGTTNDRGDATSVENNFRHMNGGRRPPNPPEAEDATSNKEDDPETVRYIPHPIHTHRHTTTC